MIISKGGYEFSFAWFFAIIIGAAVIFLAIYAATQFIGTKDFEDTSKTARQIGILLTPVETNLETLKGATISVRDDTQIFNECERRGTFGNQLISTKVRSGINNEWPDFPGVKSSFHNKYLFSDSVVEGESEFYVLSKPFKFPFKIGDLVMLWSDKQEYCFVDAFDEVKNEIDDLTGQGVIGNIVNKDSILDCSPENKKVCFSSSVADCDVIVSRNQRSVTHREKAPVFYVESSDSSDRYALLYAAIFSDPEIYECHVGRLLDRASKLAELYRDKSLYITQRGCSSAPVLPNALSDYNNALLSVFDSADLGSIVNDVRDLEVKNHVLSCKLF